MSSFFFGFQFSIEGSILPNGGAGTNGAAADADFMVTTGPSTVLGLSLMGTTIPSTVDEEILTIIPAASISSELCLPSTELVISGPNGTQLNNFIIHHESVCP